MNMARSVVWPMVVMFVVQFALLGSALGKVVNPDNDPLLGEAMLLDPARPGDPATKSRDEAASKYLAYLERATDNALISRIYFRLGQLYATRRDVERGTDFDYARATSYLEKGLGVAPDAISRDHLVARSLLAGLLSREAKGPERTQARLEHYRYLLELKHDIPVEHVLPAPGDSVERELRQLERTHFETQFMVTGRNLVSHASRGLDWRERLEEIIAAFPDDQIATLAKQAIAAKERAIEKQVTEDVLDPVVSNIEQSIELPGDTGIAHSAAMSGLAVASHAPRPAASASPDASESDGRSIWPVVIAVIAGTALLGLGALALTRRGRGDGRDSYDEGQV